MPPPATEKSKTNHNPTHVGEESGCKYNRDTLLSLMVRETPLETIPGLCNTLEFSIHTPRGHNNFKNLKTTRQKSAHFTHKHKHERIKPDTCWGTPPRGEPVEPRSLDLRTQRCQCQEWQKERARNTKRGLRNTQTIINRQETRRENTRSRRRDRRKIRSATNKQEWRGLARHAAAQLNRPTHQRVSQGTAKDNKHPNNHNSSKTTSIRKLTEDASIPNKLKEGIVPTKYLTRKLRLQV